MPQQLRVFVIMPFESGFDPVYQQFIRPIFTEAGCKVFRGDDIRNQQNVMKDVVQSIATSDLIVADLTDENPNVFYELGIAHAFRKPVILLTQSIDDVPFDLRSYRLLKYSTHFAEIAEARAVLTDYAVRFVRGEMLFGSPVTDFFAERGEPVRDADAHRVIVLPVSSLPAELREFEQVSTDDRGFLDHLTDLNEGYARLTEIMTRVSAETTSIGSTTEDVAAKIQIEAARPSEGSVSYIRKLSRGFANDLMRFSSNLSKANNEYTEIAMRTENSLEFIAKFQASAHDDPAAVHEQREELKRLLTASKGARDSYRGLAATMQAIPPLERHLGRALTRASSEVQQMADNIDRTISSLVRAIDILGGGDEEESAV